MRLGDPGVFKVTLEKAIHPWESSGSVRLKSPAEEARMPRSLPCHGDFMTQESSHPGTVQAYCSSLWVHQPSCHRHQHIIQSWAGGSLLSPPTRLPVQPHVLHPCSQTRGSSCRSSATLCTFKPPHLSQAVPSAQHAPPFILLSSFVFQDSSSAISSRKSTVKAPFPGLPGPAPPPPVHPLALVTLFGNCLSI